MGAERFDPLPLDRDLHRTQRQKWRVARVICRDPSHAPTLLSYMAEGASRAVIAALCSWLQGDRGAISRPRRHAAGFVGTAISWKPNPITLMSQLREARMLTGYKRRRESFPAPCPAPDQLRLSFLLILRVKYGVPFIRLLSDCLV